MGKCIDCCEQTPDDGYQEICNTCYQNLIRQRDEAVEEIESYDELLKLQNTRYGVATEYWRKFNKGNDNIYPDLGDLLDFLMKMIALHEVTESKHLEQIDEVKERIVKLEKDFRMMASEDIADVRHDHILRIDNTKLKADNAKLREELKQAKEVIERRLKQEVERRAADAVKGE